jgi:hypothetical protein
VALMTGIEVEIDELALHGFDPRQARAFTDAVQREIAGALAGWQPAAAIGTGAGDGGEAIATLDAGTVHVPAGAAPAQIGRSVGARVARALTDSHGNGARP